MLCFFNLAGAVHDPDEVGLEVASMDEARKVAAVHVGELIRDDPSLIWKGEEVRLEVADQQGIILFTVILLGVDAPSNPALTGKQSW